MALLFPDFVFLFSICFLLAFCSFATFPMGVLTYPGRFFLWRFLLVRLDNPPPFDVSFFGRRAFFPEEGRRHPPLAPLRFFTPLYDPATHFPLFLFLAGWVSKGYFGTDNFFPTPSSVPPRRSGPEPLPLVSRRPV